MNVIGFGLVNTAILALATVGFSLQFGITNFLNVAYGDFMTLGAYFWFTFAYRGHFGVIGGAIVGCLALGVFAVILNRLMFQRILARGARPFTMMIVTLGVNILIAFGIVILWGTQFFSISTSGNTLVHFMGTDITENQWGIIVVAAVVLVGLHLLLRRTLVGKAMRAMADDEVLTRVSGVNVKLVQDATWAITGILAALAGMAIGLNASAFNSDSGNSFLWLLIPAAFVGGLGSPYGALAGSAVVGFAIELADQFIGPNYDIVAAMVLLFAVLFVRPQGIVAVVRKAWN